MLNKVQLIGNLGADVELRSTANGNSVADLRVATTSRVKRGEQWENETEWHRVTVWGNSAENCAKYLTKGSKVHVEGRIKTEKWTDKEGNDRYTTKIVAYSVLFLDSKKDREASQSSRQNTSAPRNAGKQANSGPGDDDDIPF